MLGKNRKKWSLATSHERTPNLNQREPDKPEPIKTGGTQFPGSEDPQSDMVNRKLGTPVKERSRDET